MSTKTKNKTKYMVLCALFAALMAVLSQIIVPIGPVPFNLGVLGAFLCGIILPPLWASVSMLVYVLLALIGMPVLAGMQGGIGALFGPTGGYVIGYIAVAFLTSFGINKFKFMFLHMALMLLGLIVCYALGTAWFMLLTQNTLATSLAYCVTPFIIPDIFKLLLSYFFGKTIKKGLKYEKLI